jgi:hypothetical protein
MDGDLTVRAHEKMLASRHDLADGLAGEVGGRETGDAEVRPREYPSRQRLVHPGRGREHGVTFCHTDIIRNPVANRERRRSDPRGDPLVLADPSFLVHLPYSEQPFVPSNPVCATSRRETP